VNGDILRWPNGARIAVAVCVLFEAWSDEAWPAGQAQRASVRPGVRDNQAISWGEYGGRSGVWRLIRILDECRVPATFACSARCAELYRDAIERMVRSGHDIAAHGYTQEELLAHLAPEQERNVIRRAFELLDAASGAPARGWLTPALAWTEHTDRFLAERGVLWRGDANYTDLPVRVETPAGPIAHIPHSDYADYRALWLSPQQFFDTYKSTFDYLYRREPMSLLVVTLHCHFGGRPLMAAMLDRLLRDFARFPDVWFARHRELADWALAHPRGTIINAERFFR
jgi:peptidoglycan/xylan/chitin deacetylase (PgdA/CDA1 family)